MSRAAHRLLQRCAHMTHRLRAAFICGLAILYLVSPATGYSQTAAPETIQTASSAAGGVPAAQPQLLSTTATTPSAAQPPIVSAPKPPTPLPIGLSGQLTPWLLLRGE